MAQRNAEKISAALGVNSLRPGGKIKSNTIFGHYPSEQILRKQSDDIYADNFSNFHEASVNLHKACLNLHIANAKKHEAGLNICKACLNMHEAGVNMCEAGANMREADGNLREAGENMCEAGGNMHIANEKKQAAEASL